MKSILVTFLVSLMAVGSLWAFPTQDEIKTAGAVVGALIKTDLANANAGKAKHVEVAEKIHGLVGDAETDAAKWLLLKYAFIQYAKGGDYDKAAETMGEILAQFPDVPNALALSLITDNATRMRPDNAAKLLKYRDLFAMRKKCAAALASPKATARQKAEAQCLTGDWKAGLDALAKLGGDAGSVAAKELAADKPSMEAANFWWDYKSTLDTCGAFRAHAVEIYKKGLADGSITGLYRNLAEQRVEESKQNAGASTAPTDSVNPQYMIIDLSSGPNSKRYPVAYSDVKPVQNWTDSYKTTKLVLKHVDSGQFRSINGLIYVADKPFWMGAFEVTQKQWELVMDTKPWLADASGVGPTRPAYFVSYNAIRGDSVDLASFIGRLRARTNLEIDLPTEVQWEHACRAGSTTPFNCGNSPNLDYMWVAANSKGKCQAVGTRKPNAWGFYDMHGNVAEWSLGKIIRNGSWGSNANDCHSSYRYVARPWSQSHFDGFRIVCPASR